MNTSDLIDLEEKHLLPTYSKLPIVMSHGEGAYVYDVEDNAYLDFYGGHCVSLLGHSPEAVVSAIQEQASKLLFYSNVAYSEIRAHAAKALIDIGPEHLPQVFFANSGSEANETALKLARTFTGKSGILAMENGFHGRTLGSLAATYSDKYRASYKDILPKTHFAPFGDAEAAHQILAKHDIAAVILEPIQSIAGMQQAPASYYAELRDVCDTHDTLLIFDEVQTGVGRTGAFTYAQKISVEPDLISMAKSLGAGMPVSAVLVSQEIADTVESGDQGSTFGGGMLAMAAVKATVETLQNDQLMARAAEIFEQITSTLASSVKDVRGSGCLIGVELHEEATPVVEKLRDKGILVGTSAQSHTMRLMPPLIVSDEEIGIFTDTLLSVVSSEIPA